jgi:hypothetical protein
MPTVSPYTQVYSAIWGLLEGSGAAAVAYKATVAVGNRVKWTDSQPVRNPSRMAADVPVHEIRFDLPQQDVFPTPRVLGTCAVGKTRALMRLTHKIVGPDITLEPVARVVTLIIAAMQGGGVHLGLPAIVENIGQIQGRFERQAREQIEERLLLVTAGGTVRLVATLTQDINLAYDAALYV